MIASIRIACLCSAFVTTVAVAAGPMLISTAGLSDTPPAPWRVVGFPGQTKPFTRFSNATVDGQRVLRIDADLSYGFLVHSLRLENAPRLLQWRWRVDEPNPGSDLTRKDGDDSPVKVCAMFDLPIDAVPFIERQMLRLARLRADEDIPAASICYVWDASMRVGSTLENAFTRRIRYVVLRGPDAALRAWAPEQRDIRADFLRLFGEEAGGKVPPLMGIAIGGDADNTRGRSIAHVSDVMLH